MSNGLERLIMVALLLAVCILAVQQCGKEHTEKTELQETVVQREDSVEYWRDSAGREHALRLSTIASRDAVFLVYGREIDSLKGVLKIKDDQLISFTKAGTKTTGTLSLPVTRDTLRNISNFSFNDPWLNLEGEIGDSARINYSFRDSLTFTTYWKRKWLLGKKSYYIDAFSQNPKVNITGLRNVQISVPQPGRFGLGAYFGYGWNGREWAPNIGFGIHYSIIRF